MIKQIRGQGDLAALLLTSSQGAEVEVYLQGGTVTRWKTRGGKSPLFLSKKAVFAKGKAIRGGIPVIFPQFGPHGPLPSHGFARTALWEVVHQDPDRKEGPRVRLRLTASDTSLGIWNHQFTLEYEIGLNETLGNDTALELRMCTSNTGQSAFAFQEALHTYFAVSAIGGVRIPGLGSLEYLDNCAGRARRTEVRDLISIDGEIDRVYLNVPKRLEILEDGQPNRITLATQHYNDAVLWNPWREKSATLSDLDRTEYRAFVCLEVGNIGAPVMLAPEARHESHLVLSVNALKV